MLPYYTRPHYVIASEKTKKDDEPDHVGRAVDRAVALESEEHFEHEEEDEKVRELVKYT